MILESYRLDKEEPQIEIHRDTAPEMVETEENPYEDNNIYPTTDMIGRLNENSIESHDMANDFTQNTQGNTQPNTSRMAAGYSQRILSKLTNNNQSMRSFMTARTAPKNFKLDRSKLPKIDKKGVLAIVAKQEELKIIDL